VRTSLGCWVATDGVGVACKSRVLGRDKGGECQSRVVSPMSTLWRDTTPARGDIMEMKGSFTEGGSQFYLLGGWGGAWGAPLLGK
jgi:hypothetical protein